MSSASLTGDLSRVDRLLEHRLREVEIRFEEQLRSELPPVQNLADQVARYRGKMLRPRLVLVCGMAADPDRSIGSDHVTLAAVCEMVHMATLVHDDVLDDAHVRRRGATINRLRGNEMAVMLGDYLIASSYHLCSQLGSRAAGLLVGRASMTMCEGELLQLHHRDNWSLDEPTYFEIVRKKTGALIGLACRLGALASKADERVAHALETFGEQVGVAFQIQDDILDLTSDEGDTGKSSHKDLEKGKLTLPLIHHLCTAGPRGRGLSLDALDRSVSGDTEASRILSDQLRSTDSVEHARRVAIKLVEDAAGRLDLLPESDAKRYLIAAARSAVDRTY